MFSVNHENFPMLPDIYFYYPKNLNVFLQFCIGRHQFFSAIYKTEAYKSVKYNPKKYGKLHDISFLIDVASLGNSIFLQGCCVRWRQSLLQDSSDLKSGPFTNECIEVIKHIKNQYIKETCNEIKQKKSFDFCFRILLYNFSYFIYDWSKISRFEPWEKFKKELQKNGIFEKTDFDEFELYIDSTLNPFVINFAKVMREKYTKTYKYRLGFN